MAFDHFPIPTVHIDEAVSERLDAVGGLTSTQTAVFNAIMQRKYIGQPNHANLVQALATIGATPTELVVPTQQVIDTDIDVPIHVRIVSEGPAVPFSVNSGKTLMIRNNGIGYKRAAVGNGKFVSRKNADEKLLFVQWVGLGDSVSLTENQRQGIWDSFTINGQATLMIGPATVLMEGNYPSLPSGAHIQGIGANHEFGFGTRLKLSQDNALLFKVAGKRLDIQVRDLILDAEGRTNCRLFFVGDEGDGSGGSDLGGFIQGVTLERVAFNVGEKGLDISDPINHGKEITGVVVRQCSFLYQTESCIYVDTINSGITFDSNQILPAWNGSAVGFDIVRAGGITWLGENFPRGRNFTIGDRHADFVAADVNLTTNHINLPSHRFPNSIDPYVFDRGWLYSSGSMPTTTPTITEGVTMVYIKYRDGNTVSLHTSEAGVIADNNFFDFSSVPGSTTFTLVANTAVQRRFETADVNTTTGVLRIRAHRVPIGEVVPLVFVGADLPLGWNPEVLYFFRAIDNDTGNVYFVASDAAAGFNHSVPLDAGSGVRTAHFQMPMLGDRPLAAFRFGAEGGTWNHADMVGVQDEGFPYSIIFQGPTNAVTTTTIKSSVLQGFIRFETSHNVSFEGVQMNFGALQDVSGVGAIAWIRNCNPVYPMGGGKYADMGFSAWPLPHRFDYFVGGSLVKEDVRAWGRNHFMSDWVKIFLDMVQAYAFPNEPLLSILSVNAASPLLRLGYGQPNTGAPGSYYDFRRLGFVTGKTGFLQITGNDFASLPEYVGMEFKGHLLTNGSVWNDRVVTLASSGTVTLDPTVANHWKISPTADVLIQGSNFNLRPQSRHILEVIPVGTTPFIISLDDAHFKNKGHISTGVVNDDRRFYEFYNDGLYMVEGEARAALFLEQLSYSANHTFGFGDMNRQIIHPAADNNARTWTIPANSSIPFKIGTAFTIINEINNVQIAITTDTLTDGSNATGTRTLAAGGVATILKVAATKWKITGVGLT